MKNISFTLLIIFTFCTISFSQEFERTGINYLGIQFAKDSLGNEFIINPHDKVIISADSIFIKKDDFLEEIKETKMEQSEKEIIIRILQMKRTPKELEEELNTLRKTFTAVDEAYMATYYKELELYFGKEKLMELIHKK